MIEKWKNNRFANTNCKIINAKVTVLMIEYIADTKT